jgi:hypothetical protein
MSDGELKQEILLALRGEMNKVASGMMDAMTVIGLIACAAGNLSQEEFLNFSRKAAAGYRESGQEFGALLLEGMIKRIEGVPDHRGRGSPKH